MSDETEAISRLFDSPVPALRRAARAAGRLFGGGRFCRSAESDERTRRTVLDPSARGLRGLESDCSSSLIDGKTLHARLSPVRHEFTYRQIFFDFDLDELPHLNERLRLFGYNRFRPFSLYDRDHLPGAQGSIGERLRTYLKRFGKPTDDVHRIRLITAPRFFRIGFNPVSFFLCFDDCERLVYVVSEVNNTFGETHLYFSEDLRALPPGRTRFELTKHFHVSPFNPVSGTYEFSVAWSRDAFDIRVDIAHNGRVEFVSRLWGRGAPLDDRALWAILPAYPRTTSAALARISWQAAKLHYGRKLRIYRKPIATHPQTIKVAEPSLFERLAARAIERFLGRIRHGRIAVSLPDGSRKVFGAADTDDADTPVPRIDVKSHAFFTGTLLAGDVGFGEGYTRGHWTSDDLVGVLRTFVDNQSTLDDRALAVTYAARAMNRARHLARRNTKRNSRSNIHAHYDLGNSFFKLFLDDSMTYSGAFFERPESTLEEAQRAKIHRIIDKALIRECDHVLEIGCGWGSFAIEAAKRTGCRVTGITLSTEQLEHGRAWVEREGLADRVDLRLIDYRDLKGTYDRVVSIEMLEAVGHEFLGRYFKTLERLLSPNGIAVIQVITVPDQRYDWYRYGCDWIQRYIFPGGLCPSLTALCRSMTAHSNLFVQDAEDIGVHYARTLAEWRYNFMRRLDEVRSLGFDDEFVRTWEYYLSYCEAGFAGRLLGTLQLVLSRPNNRILPGAPGYRLVAS